MIFPMSPGFAAFRPRRVKLSKLIGLRYWWVSVTFSALDFLVFALPLWDACLIAVWLNVIVLNVIDCLYDFTYLPLLVFKDKNVVVGNIWWQSCGLVHIAVIIWLSAWVGGCVCVCVVDKVNMMWRVLFRELPRTAFTICGLLFDVIT